MDPLISQMVCPHYKWVVMRVHSFLYHFLHPSAEVKNASLLQSRKWNSDFLYGLHDTVKGRGDFLLFDTAESPRSPLSLHWHHIKNNIGVPLYRAVQSRLSLYWCEWGHCFLWAVWLEQSHYFVLVGFFFSWLRKPEFC